MVDQIVDIVLGLGANFPKLTAVFAVLYLVGVGFKLLREAIEAFVLASPSKKDDEWLKKQQESKIVKAVAFVADVLLRLKKPQNSSAPVKSL